ncbi:MAG: papain-like cysteine peptidase, partial [Clostridia bacterium]|nr:papain-like cysteine peptidase [Clostridia bacterium]
MLDNKKGIGDNRLDGQYNFISIGYFCSVASELERMGLRHESFPFDWLITENFEIVLDLIKNNFDRFLIKENLFQESNINPNYYYDQECKIHIYHDFNGTKTLD